MKKLLAVSAALLVFTTACGNEGDKKENQEDSKTKANETKKAQSNNQTLEDAESHKDVEKSTNKEQSEKASQLSDEKKAALVFSSSEASEFTLSKKEILTGIFEQNYNNEKEKKQLYKLFLVKADGYKEVPENMKFYSVYPSKGSYASIIGIGEDKVFVGGTQGAMTYDELLENGKELDLNALYNENKHFKSLDELSQKVEFKNEHPMQDEATRKEFEGKESAETMAHARSQVYQQINEFEGKPINTKDYIWDNVKWDDGLDDWTVNYRDKDLEIAGTYKKEAGQAIVKLDSNGNRIK
ncbi:hypothetical protein [Staphylococcus simulans]|uniref:hypothetical protein n=1 Tax=Staphylococcus simulans TaxID=1286 RepID=UPI000D032733|nr:hypothetical protein [Staphylococcus simulans]PTJ23930.1 hypothetical protein BU035_12130 [Staphylococcus simulans]RIN60098.1 hypothetical protein BU034_12170 [Staphylococcus simulans]